ncbi:hypothetical protein E0Z10_g4101 [Xylaria hypoxylon]|uniref:Uncharacterized protein n=1 Tax=Xylaria hypoxylon TaxID=37992 RepID=A0A4Z0YK47_9PEZI|nr:hypothetical protein E0Z10_g4101 [Xylaria hypoxylon]
MAASMDKQPNEKKNVEKKSPETKVVAKRVRKTPNPNQKRGQPTAAARLMSSPYIKFGWHKPLGGDVKEAIQGVSSIADSMYMLQLERERPIESLSLRNGLFWERRQLENQFLVSTPAVDHLDLFPEEDEVFQDTLHKIGKRPIDNLNLSQEEVDSYQDTVNTVFKKLVEKEDGFHLHYLFGAIRSREFLILPVDIKGYWITVIARFQRKKDLDGNQILTEYTDMEITDLAVVDPLPAKLRGTRRELVIDRLRGILAEGCIDFEHHNLQEIAVREIEAKSSKWQTGLIAYAISREFLRRLKVLQYRRENGGDAHDQEFLWAPFEEHYNFDAYRQGLMSACAHQCIEGSAYKIRLALEVPSEDSNYHREQLCRFGGNANYLAADEKWEIFQTQTHTHAIAVHYDLIKSPPRLPPAYVPVIPSSPSYSPTSPVEPVTSDCDQLPAPVAPMGVYSLLPLVLSPDLISEQTTDTPENPQQPVAPMSTPSCNEENNAGSVSGEAALEGWSGPPLATATLSGLEPNSPELSKKRVLSTNSYYDAAPLPKRIKIEDESS